MASKLELGFKTVKTFTNKGIDDLAGWAGMDIKGKKLHLAGRAADMVSGAPLSTTVKGVRDVIKQNPTLKGRLRGTKKVLKAAHDDMKSTAIGRLLKKKTGTDVYTGPVKGALMLASMAAPGIPVPLIAEAAAIKHMAKHAFASLPIRAGIGAVGGGMLGAKLQDDPRVLRNMILGALITSMIPGKHFNLPIMSKNTVNP